MQASAVAISGTGILCLYIWKIRHKENRREIELEVKPPTHPKLLRPAGHSLQKQLWKLVEKQDSETSAAVMATLLASILAYPAVVFGAQILGTPNGARQVPGYLLGLCAISFLAAALCGWRAYRGATAVMELRPEIRNHRLGLRGEQAVAEALHSPEVAGAGYFAFHDVPKDHGGNIDHIVLGTAGVFVIETKTARSRTPGDGKKRNRLTLSGGKVHFPWGRRDERPVIQLEDNTAVVARWLKPLVAGVVIEPLLVYPGWEVHMTERTEVKAMSSSSLRYYFHKLPTRLTVQQLQTIYAFLDRKCRDVELTDD